MKRVLGLLLFTMMLLLLSAALADVEINESVFPDEQFRRYILDAGFDADGNGRLSKAEIGKVTLVDCHSLGIKSLQGIENFTELLELRCYDNQLAELDVSKNKKLVSLSAYTNKLKKLDLSACKKLVSFSCSSNPVSELRLPDCRDLTWMDLAFTNLRELDIDGYPILEALVRAGEPTPYIYWETDEQVNWVSDTSFLAVNRQFVLTSGGEVLYDGSGNAEAAAETAEAGSAGAAAETAEAGSAETAEAGSAETAEAGSAEAAEAGKATSGSAEDPEKAKAAAEAAGKVQIARLFNADRVYTPDFDGSYATIWARIPEGYSINSDDVANVSGEYAGYSDGITLVKNKWIQLFIDFMPLGRSQEWMGYGNLKDVPESMMEAVIADYVERHNSTTTDQPDEVEVYELPGGLKVLRVVNAFTTVYYKAFVGWTMHNGYEVSISFMIHTQFGFRSPSDEDLKNLEAVLGSLEVIPD